MPINGQHGRNGQILRKVQLSKTEPGKNRNLHRPITSTEIETVIRNLPANKAQVQKASQLNSTKHLEKS